MVGRASQHARQLWALYPCLLKPIDASHFIKPFETIQSIYDGRPSVYKVSQDNPHPTLPLLCPQHHGWPMESEDSTSDTAQNTPNLVPSLTVNPHRCDCPILHELEAIMRGESQEKADKLVCIPSAAHGYMDPQSGKQVGSFRTYIIKLRENTVRRRYSDFEYLYLHLSRHYPYHIIPPIPSKQSVSGITFSCFSASWKPLVSISFILGSSGQTQHLVDYRIRCFSNFLRLLLSSPSLCRDHVLHLFLTAQNTVVWKEEATRYAAPLITILAGAKLTKVIEAPFAAALTILQQLEEATGTLIAAQKLIVKRSQDIKGALESLGTEYNGFSLEYAACADILDAVGNIHDGNATAYADVVLGRELLEESVKEIQAYVGAVKTCIKNYASLSQEFILVSERINVLRSEVLQTAARKSSAEAELPALEEKQHDMATAIATVKDCFWEELGVWLRRLQMNWTHLLGELASAEKSFAEQGIAAWKDAQSD